MKSYLTETKKQKIITEKWSISDKVDDGINIIYKAILDDYLHNAICYKIDDGLWLYKNEEIPFNVFGIKCKLTYFYYYTINKKMCDFIYKNASSLNGYDEKNKTLYITLYSINGEIQKEYTLKNLVHETEHLLQIHYGLNNNINYKKLTSDAYDYASNKIRKSDFKNYAEQVIAYLIYYSDSHEQDAFINEYYREILSNISVLLTHKAEINTILDCYKQYINYFYSNIDTNLELIQALIEYKKFGYNQNNFSTMLKKQEHRFEKKINNVKKHFQHLNEISKEGVRILPSKDIPFNLLIN